MFNNNSVGINVLGERLNLNGSKPKKAVFLDGVSFEAKASYTKVAPAPNSNYNPMMYNHMISETIVYDTLKPIIYLARAMGIFPVSFVSKGKFKITTVLLVYSGFVLLVMVGYIGYIKWDKVEIVKSAEGRFEEAVIGYLFTLYLVPVLMLPVSWYEAIKLVRVFNDWSVFERIYRKIQQKSLPLFTGNKPLIISLALPILSCVIMVVTHLTMVFFRFLQVLPYCYINTITYITGGFWYLHCDVIGKVATIIAEDFEQTLKNIGPSARVAEFRSLWMLLAKITRDVGLGSCYVLTFLSLYLFLIITLTIYGLLSTLQDGFGIKDVGLTVTAIFSIALLYFICDEAHYASNCVRVNFQKKLLLVKLSWMNEDAQQEINMFLRATEMNPTNMSLGGFFDVNRNLFKSLLATMVTYLVVLLQFQISLPDDIAVFNMTTTTTTTTIAAASLSPSTTPKPK
ncbi:PREDICTED: gustatory and odorant receptor 24 [Nicrophorus vespilloides]|uniref:Gustatory receptor n=1 Tax=Nicrophorus vespilloides TaxID=110193 RepID=A0ABM1MJV1_NICVS|nr:PREDICTED: gustatory and odorant receptor 24 [Nicrophorus vespilloides]